MVERVTLVSRNRTVLASNQTNLGRVAELQDRLASGKRVDAMSDDPNAARRALMFRVQRFEGQSYLGNIERSQSFLEASDSAFRQMAEVMDQAKGVAVQGANGTQDAASRQALATSVDGILSRLTDLANSVHDGRFIFAGTEVLTQPFVLRADGSGVDYQGNLDEFAVAISPSERATVNQDGFTLFKQEVDVFATLIDLRDALRANDPEAVGDLIGTIDDAHEHINNLAGALGGRMQRLDLAAATLRDADARLGELVSREVDADLAATVMELQAAQVALEAGLQSGARVIQPSLLDYL